MRREAMKSSQKGNKSRLLTASFLPREITFIRDGLTFEGWRYQICLIVIFPVPNYIVQVSRARREAALCLAFQDLYTQN